MGAHLQAPEVNRKAATTPAGTVVWLGWQHVIGLEPGVVERLSTERAKAPFQSLEDFAQRVPVGLPQLLRLIRVGAFAIWVTPKKNCSGGRTCCTTLFSTPS